MIGVSHCTLCTNGAIVRKSIFTSATMLQCLFPWWKWWARFFPTMFLLRKGQTVLHASRISRPTSSWTWRLLATMGCSAELEGGVVLVVVREAEVVDVGEARKSFSFSDSLLLGSWVVVS